MGAVVGGIAATVSCGVDVGGTAIAGGTAAACTPVGGWRTCPMGARGGAAADDATTGGGPGWCGGGIAGGLGGIIPGGGG